MFREREHRLHEMQIAYAGSVGFDNTFRQKICLFLVVALNTDAVTGLYNRIKEFDDIGLGNLTAARKICSALESGSVVTHLPVPAF
jgi:hypothetical protein